MKITTTPEVADKKMPRFWQFFVAIQVMLAISVIFISNDSWFHITNALLSISVSTAVIAGIIHQKHELYPWGLLLSGIVLIDIAIVMHTLTFFGIPIHANIPFWIEETGLVLATFFAFSNMLLFENRFNLKGFTIDYSLLIISSTFFIFLLSPDLLNTFLYKTDFSQQLLIINVFFGIVLLSMAILHHILVKKIKTKDIVRIVLILFVVAHFVMDGMLSFAEYENNLLISRISWSTYQLAGVLTVLFVYMEKLSLDYKNQRSSRLGAQFMWAASSLAIFVIPVGVIIRWFLNLPAIDSLIIGLGGSFLSILVIFRFIVLVSNAGHQRKQLRSIAHTDALTGLPNYLGYLEKLHKQRMDNTLVFCINIEDFKAINDLYGRRLGDEVLKSLAKRLQKIPNIKLAARTGSDLFLAVFQTPKENIQSLAESLQQQLGVWDTVLDQRIAVPLTFGASHSVESIKPEKQARQVEQALKIARSQHTCFSLFSEDSSNKLLPRHKLREILQKAVDDNYLPVHFQPIYNLADGSLRALEMLIRVESKEHGLLMPGQFLEQAKSYGQLTLLTQVCINMIAKYFDLLPNVTININLPPYMLNNPDTLDDFLQRFNETKLPPKRFCIEVTEDGEIPAELLIPSVHRLKEYGFSIAMDDFGTGYSSLARLSILSVDSVKIDRSLLLAAVAGNRAVLECAITLAKRLGVTAIVEGVENLEQLALIKLLGADSVQGFLLSEPVHASRAVNLSLNANDIIAEF